MQYLNYGCKDMVPTYKGKLHICVYHYGRKMALGSYMRPHVVPLSLAVFYYPPGTPCGTRCKMPGSYNAIIEHRYLSYKGSLTLTIAMF